MARICVSSRSPIASFAYGRACHGRLRGCSIAITSTVKGLFRLACEHDLEGIAAKRKSYPDLPERQTTWLRVRNQSYSQ